MGPITTLAAVSTSALVVMTWLYLDKRDDLASEVERCNTDKITSILEAERITRQAQQEAADRTIAELVRKADQAEIAIGIANTARLEAESRPARVRTIIERVADVDACIDSPVHPSILSCLRDDASCSEPGSS